ncbi:hypothetical protein [Helicobacter ganmani]|uniref:hypothetical protein n=2 Tax=Helicobacteraceae TaxID=72293 RepID=UPI003A843506
MLKYLLEFKENIGAEMSSVEFEKYNEMSLKKLVSFLEKESIKFKDLESNFTKKIQEKSELISHLKQIIKERIDSEN